MRYALWRSCLFANTQVLNGQNFSTHLRICMQVATPLVLVLKKRDLGERGRDTLLKEAMLAFTPQSQLEYTFKSNEHFFSFERNYF